MAIADLDDVVVGKQTARPLRWNKASATCEGAGFIHSGWKLGTVPAAGATPSTGNGAIPTKATTGAIPFTNPSGGKSSYIVGLHANAITKAHDLMLYDRLWHNSGLDGSSVALQSFTQPALTRYTDGIGNRLFVEVYTAFGASAFTLTVNYTDETGVAAVATLAFPANAPTVGQMMEIPLVTGGIRSVQSCQLSGSSGAAGDFGFVLAHHLTKPKTIPTLTGVDVEWDEAELPVVQDNACIAIMFGCLDTDTGQAIGEARLAQV